MENLKEFKNKLIKFEPKQVKYLLEKFAMRVDIAGQENLFESIDLNDINYRITLNDITINYYRPPHKPIKFKRSYFFSNFDKIWEKYCLRGFIVEEIEKIFVLENKYKKKFDSKFTKNEFLHVVDYLHTDDKFLSINNFNIAIDKNFNYVLFKKNGVDLFNGFFCLSVFKEWINKNWEKYNLGGTNEKN